MTTLQKLEKLIYEGFKETDRQFKETDRQFKETDRQFKETDRQRKETDRQLRELGIQLAGLGGSVGRFAEHMVAPAVKRLLTSRAINITSTYHRAEYQHNGGMMEVDILGVGPRHVIAIEVKMRLEQQDVKDFLQTLPSFFEYFEEFRGRTLFGAVAGMSIDQDVDRFAYRNGLFVFAQSGENVRLLNDEKFLPKAYRYQA